MRELSLFSGAGGGLLATKWLLGWETVGYVEIDGYCQRIIAQRIGDGLLDEAPIFGDVRAFIDEGFAGAYQGMVDVVTAGFPCQPFSLAGRRKAEKDNRNMWPETLRAIEIIEPKWVLLENVPGLLAGSHGYFGRILKELAESGYDARWRCLSAAEVGAPHIRNRLWVVAIRSRTMANTKGLGWENGNTEDIRQDDRQGDTFGDGSQILANTKMLRWETVIGDEQDGILSKDVGNTSGKRLEIGEEKGQQSIIRSIKRSDWWDIEPSMGRVADGVANRVDRLKAIGNGQVPVVVVYAWKMLWEKTFESR